MASVKNLNYILQILKQIAMNNRRNFIRKIAGFTTAILSPIPWVSGCHVTTNSDRLGDILPTRLLGKTGKEVTMLGLGGYHIGWTTERDAQETIEAALEGGIRFFDNAESYGPHTSEERYGKYLTPTYRDLVFVMTKTTAKDGKNAKEHLEASLKRMKTDYVDLWQVHAISSPQDVDDRISNGILDVMTEAKTSGKVKHIGFTGHQDPKAHTRMLDQIKEDDLFETLQMPINPLDAAKKKSFIGEVMQEAVNRNYGILAMKTLAGGRFFPEKIQVDELVWETDDPIVPDRIGIQDALYFTWSLPVSVLISGAENKEMILEKISMARNFSKFSESQRIEIIEKVMDLSPDPEGIEYYKQAI
jgi:aryl-alcohol dehydrogenase-like predicted oxidoreductase